MFFKLYIENNGVIEKLDGPVAFNVKPLRKHTLSGSSHDDYNSFRKRVSSLYIDMSRYQDEFEMMKTKVQILDKASLQLSTFSPDIINKISEFKNKYNKFESEIDGTVSEVLIQNSDPIEYNQPLFKIKPI